jgi:DNA-3-methyladenine glycosylase I
MFIKKVGLKRSFSTQVQKVRCWSPDEISPLMLKYHDTEWGVPVHDDRRLFEMLVLQSAQAGLSWNTILNKRENYRSAFDGFGIKTVANYDANKINSLLTDDLGIIRNKAKILAAIHSANAVLRVQEEFGSFDEYLWSFVPNRKPIVTAFEVFEDIPARTKESEAISKDMKKRGFKFVGPVVMYAFMQSTGMTQDHLTNCYRYQELSTHLLQN